MSLESLEKTLEELNVKTDLLISKKQVYERKLQECQQYFIKNRITNDFTRSVDKLLKEQS